MSPSLLAVLTLDALQPKGLELRGVEPASVPRVEATDHPTNMVAPELILFCVKLYDTARAAELLKPFSGPETTVLTLQNGIESSARLASHFGQQRILGGAAYFPANITAPGEVTYLGKIAAMMRAAGLVAVVADDTERLLWEKFLLIAGTSAATTLCRLSIVGISNDPDRRWLLRTAVDEAHAVAIASGITLSEGVVDAVVAALDGNPADGKSSQLVDLENGKRLELEGLSGAIVRLGLEQDVATPVHRTVYAALKQFVSPENARARR